jgi:hypothetical protein
VSTVRQSRRRDAPYSQPFGTILRYLHPFGIVAEPELFARRQIPRSPAASRPTIPGARRAPPVNGLPEQAIPAIETTEFDDVARNEFSASQIETKRGG